MLDKISVVITTKNEEKNILDCLKSIFNQKNIGEIIVVDNFSTDNTKEICEKFDVNFISGGPERSAQRNLAIKNSKYNYLLILDADMKLSNNFCVRILNYLKKNNLDAVYFKEKILKKNKIVQRLRNLERSLYDYSTNNCPRFLKKSIFKKIGYFDENITGFEDWDFNNRIILKNINSGVADIYVYHNEKEISLFETVQKKIYYYDSSLKFKKKWKNYKIITSDQISPLNRFFFIFFKYKNYKFFFKDPLFFLLLYIFINIKFVLLFFSIILKKK